MTRTWKSGVAHRRNIILEGGPYKENPYMAKQVKIKDIAKMAGVSSGTVDRILHNRGNVSAASREAVEKALQETGYRYNIHTSAVSLKKTYKIVIAIPTAIQGEYWGTVQKGIEHAFQEYSDITIDCEYAYYNQFDIYSCRSSFNNIPDRNPSAVIIGATFASETTVLCRKLDEKRIPYVFVDSVIANTHPSATYSSDQDACGRIVGRMLNLFTPRDTELAVFGSRRIGNERATNSMTRMNGLKKYFDSLEYKRVIKESKISVLDPDESKKNILEFLDNNPKVKGIAVLNSRGFILADILASQGINDIRIITFDMTLNNVRCVENGTISAIIHQRPELQGFYAVKGIIRILLYNIPDKNVHHLMPADIIIKENLLTYKEIYSE